MSFRMEETKAKAKELATKVNKKEKEKEKARLMARAKDRASRKERAKVDSVMCASVSDKSNEVAVEVGGLQKKTVGSTWSSSFLRDCDALHSAR